MEPKIDRLRGLFAIFVALGHFHDIFIPITKVDFLRHVLSPLRVVLGFNWVIGFIVLSGYCIARSTFTSTRNGTFSFVRYSQLRLSRIFPLLIVCIMLTGVLEWLMFNSEWRSKVWNKGINLESFLYSLTGLAGFLGQFGSFAPTYSVSYELLYYLMWGLTYKLLGGRLLSGMSMLGLCILTYLYGKYCGGRIPFSSAISISAWVFLLSFSWCLGCLAFLFEKKIASYFRKIPMFFCWLCLFGYFILAFKLGIYPAYGETDFKAVVFYVGLSGAFIILIMGHLGSEKAISISWVDRLLGEISYPLFLIHGPLAVFLAFLTSYCNLSLFYTDLMLLALTTSLLFAYVLALSVEGPVLKWRARFR